MPHDKSHTVDWKGLALKIDALVNAATGVEINLTGFASAVGLTLLTNSSGGTTDNTVEVIPAATAATTDVTAASLTSTNAALTAIKNDIAELTVKLNALLTALKS